jgi:hypothetical protein
MRLLSKLLAKLKPKPAETACGHRWVVFSTALQEGALMLQCLKCGAFGTVDDPSREEWNRAHSAPSHPYPWHDESRITLRPQHQPKPDYWARQMDVEPEAN